MKYLFVFLLTAISSIVIGQNRYHVDKTTFALYDTVVNLKHDMKPINGLLYCDNGDMGIYVNGKEDGLHRYWYDNGQLWYENNFKDCQLHGVQRGWHEDGRLYYETNWKHGKKYGLHRQWYENGQLKYEVNYKENKKEGRFRYWDKYGNIKQ